MLCHHLISNLYALSASVNGESARVGIFDHLHVVSIQYVVGECETPFMLVCLDNLPHFRCINVTKYVRKVTRNVVPPECSGGKFADL